MPISGNNLPVNLTAAEQATARQAVRQQAERAMNAAAGVPVQDPPDEPDSPPVRPSQETESTVIEGESRGAHSFELKKEERREEPQEEAGEPPPDPDGRGQKLDIVL